MNRTEIVRPSEVFPGTPKGVRFPGIDREGNLTFKNLAEYNARQQGLKKADKVRE